jgi:HK97 family phage major capsid protein
MENKETVLAELNNMKAALEASLTEKAVATVKNLDEKMEAVNEAIEALKAKKPDVSVEEFKSVKDNLDITIKAFDQLQERMKPVSTRSSGPVTWNEMIVKSIDENKSSIVTVNTATQKMQLKTVGDMTIANNLTGNIPFTYREGLVPVPFENIHVRNLFSVTPSETDSYHFYRHTVGEGTINFQGGENNAKAQIDEDLTEVTVNLDYLAGFLKISRKMLRNFTALRAYIGRWLPERYYQREDEKAYQAMIALASGATNTTGTDMMSNIIRTIGAMKQARYNPSAIIVDGNVWARLLTFKASTSGEFTQPIGVVNILPSGQLSIVGIPVYTATWVGGMEAIIADTRYFEIIQSEGLSLQFFEQDDDNVQKNKITARIEASVGFAVLDGNAISVLPLESVS